MEKFSIKCKFCGNEDPTQFQVTMVDDEGYSNYTVMDEGYFEIKCIKCGTFGSEDHNKKDMPSNKLDQFEITCKNCGSNKNSYIPGDVDGDDFPEGGYLKCNECNIKESE
jgi:hypothetical protein